MVLLVMVLLVSYYYDIGYLDNMRCLWIHLQIANELQLC